MPARWNALLRPRQAVMGHHPDLQLQILEDVGEVRYGDWTAAEISKLVQRKMWSVIQPVSERAYFRMGADARCAVAAVNAIEGLVKKHPRGQNCGCLTTVT